jgi:3-oxoacyl-[acyl-carrier protein] reductase
MGKRALVTGASRGIGAAIAKTLADERADVAITYEKSAESAAEVVSAIKAKRRRGVAIQADSADAAAVQASVDTAVAELGGLDILVNNAGILRLGELPRQRLRERGQRTAGRPVATLSTLTGFMVQPKGDR